MTFKELSYIYFERVFRLHYQDDEEWQSFVNAHNVSAGTPPALYERHIEEQILKGVDFDDLCTRDREFYLNNIDPDTLNPPPISI